MADCPHTAQIGPMYVRFARHQERLLHGEEFNDFAEMLRCHIDLDGCETCRAERDRWNKWADEHWPSGWDEFCYGFGLVFIPAALWAIFWPNRK